jgi:hypothetical protein
VRRDLPQPRNPQGVISRASELLPAMLPALIHRMGASPHHAHIAHEGIPNLVSFVGLQLERGISAFSR